jgi:hypothetical protein
MIPAKPASRLQATGFRLQEVLVGLGESIGTLSRMRRERFLSRRNENADLRPVA